MEWCVCLRGRWMMRVVRRGRGGCTLLERGTRTWKYSAINCRWHNGELFVLMAGDSNLRHDAMYNCIESIGDSLLSPDGFSVGATYSRFPAIAVGPIGRCFVAVHANPAEELTHSFLAPEFLPCSGAFEFFQGMGVGAPCYEPIRPHIDIDLQGRIQLISSDSFRGHVGCYNRLIPNYNDSLFLFLEHDTEVFQIASNLYFPTIDIACSRLSDRVAIAWVADLEPMSDPENVMMRISEDGGVNWSDEISLTGLPPIDTMCVINGGSPEECNGDTLRPWHDLSMIFDEDDNLHIAFTASGFYYFNPEGIADPARLIYSNIWHWGEETDDFSLIGEGGSGMIRSAWRRTI